MSQEYEIPMYGAHIHILAQGAHIHSIIIVWLTTVSYNSHITNMHVLSFGENREPLSNTSGGS